MTDQQTTNKNESSSPEDVKIELATNVPKHFSVCKLVVRIYVL